MPIRVLSDEVAAKIAAGEVIERPASVIKELVENAIDAGATSIRVEVRQGGRRLMRVSDDGCGIPAAEAELAFARHATSKLRSVDDLEHIATLGFRGEALASIAAVSQVTLVTRAQDEEMGTRMRVEGAHLARREPSGHPRGTTISVENLFYNVPARLKFLHQDAFGLEELGFVFRAELLGSREVDELVELFPTLEVVLHLRSEFFQFFVAHNTRALVLSVWGEGILG